MVQCASWFLVTVGLLGAAVRATADGPASTSYFNERWLSAVVSIESADKAIGTGFLIGGCDRTVLATAAHVIRPPGSTTEWPGLRYRRSDVPEPHAVITDETLRKGLGGGWNYSATSDVAVRDFGWHARAKDPVVIPRSHFIAPEELRVGAPLLVLGFPLGLRSAPHNEPIARHGILAGRSPKGLLVEAFVFPGNSGGPVVYVPHLKVGDGIKSGVINEERLVGIVIEYVYYPEAAVSAQTGRPRVVFEENSGLAVVVPLSELLALLETSGLCKPPPS